MFALSKILVTSIFVGLVCCVLAVGTAGILIGMPLAFMEFLPGDQLEELRQLPRDLLVAGFGGLAIGMLSGLASQFTGHRVSYVYSTVLVTACVLTSIAWTHPSLNLSVDSTLGDYLNSYRLTALAALAGAASVIGLGLLMKLFRGGKSRSS